MEPSLKTAIPRKSAMCSYLGAKQTTSKGQQIRFDVIEMDQELAEIYQQLSEQITPEEFETRIAEKVSLMGGLCTEGRCHAGSSRVGSW